MNGYGIIIDLLMSHIWEMPLPEVPSADILMVLKYSSHINIGAM